MMTIEEMKQIKQQTGLSFEQISALSGVPLGTVQKVLSGITRNPRWKTLQSLESAFARVASSPAAPAVSPSRPETGSPSPSVHPHSYQYREESAETGMVRDQNAVYGSSYTDGSSARSISQDSPVKYDRQGTYTLKDYLALPDDQRVELIDGVFYDMSAPYTVHQRICSILTQLFMNFIDDNGGPCIVLPSPVDVQLDEDDRTIVEPDICICCKPEKIHKERIYGAPDMLIEILSPSTRKKDLTLKMWKYANAGVREYWTVDPDRSEITVFDFEHEYAICKYTFHDTVPVGIYDGKLKIDFEKISEKIQ